MHCHNQHLHKDSRLLNVGHGFQNRRITRVTHHMGGGEGVGGGTYGGGVDRSRPPLRAHRDAVGVERGGEGNPTRAVVGLRLPRSPISRLIWSGCGGP
jgi:hypothetical protein